MSGDSVNLMQQMQREITDRDNRIIILQREVESLQGLYQNENQLHHKLQLSVGDLNVKIQLS